MLTHRADPEYGLAILVTADGFALRTEVEAAVVGPNGITGTILGGLLDTAIVHRQPGASTVTARISDEAAHKAGAVCGGPAEVAVVPLTSIPNGYLQAVAEHRPAVLAIARANHEAMSVTSSATDGAIGGIDTDEVIAVARSMLGQGASNVARIESNGTELVVVSSIPVQSLHIVGSGPMADAIAAQFDLMGWHTSSSDSKSAALNYLERSGTADAVVVLSHDRAVDVPVLAAAVTAPVGYVGAMGSRRTQQARADALAQLAPDLDLSRINGPVGLDLAARTPPEVAVSIAAEVLMLRAGRDAAQLGSVNTPIHR